MVQKWYRFEPIVKLLPWMLNILLPASVLSSILDLTMPFISFIRLSRTQNTVIDYTIILLSSIYLEPVKPFNVTCPAAFIIFFSCIISPLRLRCAVAVADVVGIELCFGGVMAGGLQI